MISLEKPDAYKKKSADCAQIEKGTYKGYDLQTMTEECQIPRNKIFLHDMSNLMYWPGSMCSGINDYIIKPCINCSTLYNG